MNSVTLIVVQCVLGSALGLLLHFLKKAKESEKTSGTRTPLLTYILQDPKEFWISVILTAILVVGLPELTVLAQQVALQMFGLQLPPLQRSFFLCAILGGFGNSLADIVGAYFGGERLTKFVSK